mmetsp:Transcript_31654/g.72566  ORF Transcript_31654/g.72566 Transcript_31654/m.72566 type:complete len:114 (+) Transcript_31654:144-485(+)
MEPIKSKTLSATRSWFSVIRNSLFLHTSIIMYEEPCNIQFRQKYILDRETNIKKEVDSIIFCFVKGNSRTDFALNYKFTIIDSDAEIRGSHANKAFFLSLFAPTYPVPEHPQI